MTGLSQEYINALIERINSVSACDELQAVSDEISKFIADQIAACNAELAILQTLLTSPTDLSGVISWVKSVISLITGGVAKYQAMLIAYAQLLTQLVNAITNKATSLSCPNIRPPHL